jgi:predicted nucleic acid-binding protein
VALRFLIDTSVVKRLGHAQFRAVFEPLATAGVVGRPTICDLEVGYSARTSREWDEFVGCTRCLRRDRDDGCPRAPSLAGATTGLGPSRRGRKIPDLLVAAAAEELKISVLHYDADYDLIASVTGQRCDWVVPAGTVD